MIWQERPLEKHLEWFLIQRFEAEGKALWANYQSTRNDIINNVLPHIAKVEPNLTDHGSDHIVDVIDNAALLLGFKNEHHEPDIMRASHHFSPHEILCLLLGLCLHDIGNLLGREEHQAKVTQVWNSLKSWKLWTPQERNLIISLCRAHSSGKSQTFDTLKPLTLAPVYFLKQKVNMAELAALIRFSDELAEGPHRTSQSLSELDIIADASKIFHIYALCTQIAIDRANGRIALTYVVDMDNPSFPTTKRDLKKMLKDVLTTIYERALKLNRERQLARYYASFLGDMRETSVSLAIQKQGCDICLPLQPLTFNELGTTQMNIALFGNLDSRYSISNLLEEVFKAK